MKEKHFRLLRWLPVGGAIALVILIAIISGVTVKEMNEAIYWRNRTYDVSLKAQAEEDDLIHAEGNVRHYAAKGTASLLIEYQNETNSEVQELSKLTELTRDDPEQQRRLKELDAALKAVFEHDKSVVSVFARQGPEAALKAEDEGQDELDTAIQDLEVVKDEEKKLLDKRDAAEQADYHKATGVLITGSVLAALLLVLANYFASREMTRRRRSEQKQRELIQELQTALAEVKTLSGLIPICGWCKKVRSDEGFWQSVETYVGTHTDATFTHGMCPNCAKQWKTDVAAKKE
jgi:CHASE3 domain sensor protein